MPPVCPAHSGIDARVTAVEEEVADHRVMLRRLQNRPPAWVTLVIGLLTFALGWTVNAKKAGLDPGPETRTQQSTENRNY
jgi:hypothetical protein